MGGAYQAAEIAEQRRRDHLAARKPFVSESTFSHPSKLDLLREAQQAGFAIVMYHVNVRSPELSVMRVAGRVQAGGHDVPESKIRERYTRNQQLIRQAILESDRGFVYDNSQLGQPPALALAFKGGQVVRTSSRVPAWARELYADELQGIDPARLNPGAASFAEARSIAQQIAGPDAAVLVGGIASTRWTTGPIVAATAEHWLQQTQAPTTFVAHFRNSFQGQLDLNSAYTITYVDRTHARAVLASTVDRAGITLTTLRELIADTAMSPQDQAEALAKASTCIAEKSARGRPAVVLPSELRAIGLGALLRSRGAKLSR
jgi:predicted ABC-type ATPase